MDAVAIRLSGAHLALGSGAGRREVLRDVDVEVARGELLTVVGPSGSGKSTLLAVLAGLLPLDSGRLELGEHSAGHHPGIVFQDPLLLPWLTVAENVALGLGYRRQGGRLGRRARRARLTRAAEVLGELGIGDLAERLPDELSGGQAQRVAIARTIVVDPAVVLLDEPFGALDPRTRRELQDWLLALRARRTLSAVLVTHDVDEALHLGDRVAVLSAAGRPLELMANRPGDTRRRGVGATRSELLERLGVPLIAAV
jgi:sulfate transport system ATP-binding protein/sulfonate transport system ATP-binding protein